MVKTHQGCGSDQGKSTCLVVPVAHSFLHSDPYRRWEQKDQPSYSMYRRTRSKTNVGRWTSSSFFGRGHHYYTNLKRNSSNRRYCPRTVGLLLAPYLPHRCTSSGT